MWYSCLINITNALLGGRDMYVCMDGTRIAKHIYEMRKKKVEATKNIKYFIIYLEILFLPS